MASDTAFDLILMDIQMPEMDGLAASRQLRSMPGTAQTPIIAMTANAYAEDRAACIAAGMNDYVTKPVDPPILYDVLAHWLPRPGAHKNAPSAQAVAAQMEALVRPSMNEPAPGLNLGRGLAFFANNADVYRRVLGQFADLYEAGISAVTQWLSAPSSSLHESVRRELHSLGGASSAVGAEEIGKRAANISHEFRENPATDELAPQVTALMNDLSGLIAGIRRHLESTVANQK